MRRDLVEHAMAGDHGAFSELARMSIGRLYAAACLILRDDQKAEDATQDALVAAWRDLSALRDPDRFEAWLHRLLVRSCYREARRGRRRWAIELEVRETAVPALDPSIDIADRDVRHVHPERCDWIDTERAITAAQCDVETAVRVSVRRAALMRMA